MTQLVRILCAVSLIAITAAPVGSQPVVYEPIPIEPEPVPLLGEADPVRVDIPSDGGTAILPLGGYGSYLIGPVAETFEAFHAHKQRGLPPLRVNLSVGLSRELSASNAISLVQPTYAGNALTSARIERSQPRQSLRGRQTKIEPISPWGTDRARGKRVATLLASALDVID